MLKKIFISFLIVSVLIFISIVFLRTNLTIKKETVKEKYSMPNSKFLNWEIDDNWSKNNEIHYTDNGKGFPILMVHGFGGNSRDFYILDSLLNKDYRVISVDLPGFGLSDFPKQLHNKTIDYTEVYDHFFTFLLDTLNIDSCYIMGNSLGGMMCWNLATKHPNVVKKMVLFNSAGYDMEQVKKTANAEIFTNPIIPFLLKKGIPMFFTKQGISKVFYRKLLLTEDRIQRTNDLWNREGNLDHIINMSNSNQTVDESTIKKVTCPTLIIWGKQDKIIALKYADKFYKDIKGSKKIIYDSCGHVPMLEKPLEVKRDVLNFLQAKN